MEKITTEPAIELETSVPVGEPTAEPHPEPEVTSFTVLTTDSTITAEPGAQPKYYSTPYEMKIMNVPWDEDMADKTKWQFSSLNEKLDSPVGFFVLMNQVIASI